MRFRNKIYWISEKIEISVTIMTRIYISSCAIFMYQFAQDMHWVHFYEGLLLMKVGLQRHVKISTGSLSFDVPGWGLWELKSVTAVLMLVSVGPSSVRFAAMKSSSVNIWSLKDHKPVDLNPFITFYGGCFLVSSGKYSYCIKLRDYFPCIWNHPIIFSSTASCLIWLEVRYGKWLHFASAVTWKVIITIPFSLAKLVTSRILWLWWPSKIIMCLSSWLGLACNKVMQPFYEAIHLKCMFRRIQGDSNHETVIVFPRSPLVIFPTALDPIVATDRLLNIWNVSSMFHICRGPKFPSAKTR